MTPPAPRGRFAVAAAATSLFAAATLVDVAPGLNVVVVGALMGFSVLLWAPPDLSRGDWAFGVVAFVLLSMFAVRASEMLLFVDLCAAAGLASLALRGGTTWRAVVRGVLDVLTKLHRGFGLVVAPLFERAARHERWNPAWIRGSAVGISLALVFGMLFASADRAFAQMARDAFVPEWDVGLIPARIFVATMVAAFTGGYALVARRALVAKTASPWTSVAAPTPGRRRLQTVEWVIPIALIDLVFAAFVTVQLAVLFGGQQHVLQTAGLTYAQYARSGFFQLVVVAALVLVVIAITVSLAKPLEGRERVAMRALLGALCALTLVVLVSALYRLGLYEEAYGFTHLRFAVHVAILWLGAVIGLVVLAGALWRADWLPRVAVAMTAVVLLAVNGVAPDRFIADHNIARFERTGKLDVSYLASLSADAAPALVTLPADELACVLSLRSEEPISEPLLAFNLARARARDLLGDFRGLASRCRSYNP
ncbi:MAG TPA: DUF4173 domain-containing protein [Actinomycetota bacterium]|nr:DUF4173 domain-containing protein [Actinomycetota bacterium]